MKFGKICIHFKSDFIASTIGLSEQKCQLKRPPKLLLFYLAEAKLNKFPFDMKQA